MSNPIPSGRPLSAREFFSLPTSGRPFIPELHADDCENVDCVRCIPPAPQIAALDVPLPVVAEQTESCAVLRDALAATHSRSDELAYRLDLYLVTHPDAPISTDDDYPAFSAWLADRIAQNGAQA